MRNLEQLRAAAALEAVNDSDSDSILKSKVSGIPALILTSGLNAAVAFAIEKGSKDFKRPEMKKAIDHAARHLARVPGLERFSGIERAEQLRERLSAKETSYVDLQRATTEVLAFLTYLKRFAPSS